MDMFKKYEAVHWTLEKSIFCFLW